MRPRKSAHDLDRDFLRLMQQATLADIESWAADMRDPDSNLAHPDYEWKHVAIARAFKRITGQDLSTP